MTLTVFVILTVLLLVVGVPVCTSLIIPSILFILANGVSSDLIVQRVFSGMNAMTLLCIPFFLLAGEIMGKGGIASRLINLARSIVGGMRGGLAYVTIVACAFFAAVTGSSVACCFALGAILIPEMCASGYSRNFATAVVGAGSIMGPIIPPSVALVVYGCLTNASISDLYFVGIPGGLLMALFDCIVVFFLCRKEKSGNYIAPRNPDGSLTAAAKPPFFKSLVAAIPALGTPIIILGGILGGIVTPTEASVVAVVYSLIVSCFIYKELHLKDLPKMLKATGVASAKIFYIIGAATLFAWVFTFTGAPQKVMTAMTSLTSNKYLLLLILNLIFLIMGMFFETTTMYILAIPIFLPLLQKMQIDLVYFGVMISINATIGQLTPPFGTVLFSCVDVGKAPLHGIVSKIWPFIMALIALLVFLVFCPQSIMWILG